MSRHFTPNESASLRLPPADATTRPDALIERLAIAQGQWRVSEITRADVLRLAVARGLEVLEAELPPLPEGHVPSPPPAPSGPTPRTWSDDPTVEETP